MKGLMTKIFAAVAILCLVAGVSCLRAQQLQQTATSEVRIELTGGDSNKPIDNASVYLRFYDDPVRQKGKSHEVDLKTNQDGTLRYSPVPQGKILIQIVAEGWKTYGQWHQINQDPQTIQIHLDRPPKLVTSEPSQTNP